MPITQEIECKQGKILRWDISEDSGSLERMCISNGISLPPAMHLEARRQQVMVTMLLHGQLFPGTELRYEKTGKPMVSTDATISISHSGNTVVMMRGEISCGVDIEKIHSRIRKVRHKFLSDGELLVTEKSSDFELAQFWTAKEAMFKVSGSDRVFMRSNIFVHDLTSTRATAVLIDGTTEITRQIRFHEDGDLMLAWTEPQ